MITTNSLNPMANRQIAFCAKMVDVKKGDNPYAQNRLRGIVEKNIEDELYSFQQEQDAKNILNNIPKGKDIELNTEEQKQITNAPNFQLVKLAMEYFIKTAER